MPSVKYLNKMNISFRQGYYTIRGLSVPTREQDLFSDYIQRGAISKSQFDKSLVVLTVKMGMSGLVD